MSNLNMTEEPLFSLEGREHESIVWGIAEGAPYHISRLPDALRLQVSCMGCGQRLVARRGKVKRWHYKHLKAEEDCALYSPETRDHFNTKHSLALALTECLGLPLTFALRCKQDGTIGHRGTELVNIKQPWNRVEVEYGLSDVRPDVLLLNGDTPVLAIEVAVSSHISPEKEEKYARRSLPWVEVHGGGNLAYKNNGFRQRKDCWEWNLSQPLWAQRSGPKKSGCPICSAYRGWRERALPERWSRWTKYVESATAAGFRKDVWRQDVNLQAGSRHTFQLLISDFLNEDGTLRYRVMSAGDPCWVLASARLSELEHLPNTVRQRFSDERTQFLAPLMELGALVHEPWDELATPFWLLPDESETLKDVGLAAFAKQA